ncbi:Pre-mRNA-splicing factor [Gamsiella multidivaricata]|nr:Pre-mRNA-splicing factor [Gamsiella multidivaricata]
MSRPARRQVAKEKVFGQQGSVAGRSSGQPGQTYNIYYDRWSGGGRSRESGGSGKEKAAYRCDLTKDSGRTKGTYNPNAYFCAFFAKGCCPNGEDCGWLHRIPTRQDHVDSGMDVFGRERFDEHRDDRGGVGSMRSDSRTLYVGRIQPSPDIQAVVEKHFSAWGEVERLKVLADKGVAFVTYRSRLNAEFAKEAMANQSLDHTEVLNIRWATEDPNPRVQAVNKRKAVELTREVIESKLSVDFKQAQHLPGSEKAEMPGPGKRQKQESTAAENDTSNGAHAQVPQLYRGADGQYYYDYGDYGYNHETQQYDPIRLGHYQESAGSGSSAQGDVGSVPSLQDRVKASLSTAAPNTASPAFLLKPLPGLLSGTTIKASEPKQAPSMPNTSALSALIAYGSDDSTSEDGD